MSAFGRAKALAVWGDAAFFCAAVGIAELKFGVTALGNGGTPSRLTHVTAKTRDFWTLDGGQADGTRDVRRETRERNIRR